jgi:hypothetical protein
MKSKFISSKCCDGGAEDHRKRDLYIYFDNGLCLETTVFQDANNDIYLRSPYVDGELTVSIRLKESSFINFEITKSYSKIGKNNELFSRYKKLKYWVYIKSKHSERKRLIDILKQH